MFASSAAVYGDRCRFIPVETIARACGLSLALPRTQFDGKSVNLCTGIATPVYELYLKMCQEAGAPHAPILADPRIGDIEHSCGDPGLARELGVLEI